ncbi:MAG: BLUF domain-containing protein [Sandaracinaceae bacterium]
MIRHALPTRDEHAPEIAELTELVYSSRATRRLSSTELEGILTQVRARNAERGITGVLLHHEGSFLQVLEGPPLELTELFAKIGRDPRHDGIVLLRRRPIRERHFASWSMGFCEDASSATHTFGPAINGYVDFLRSGSLDVLGSGSSNVLPILEGFREGRYRR